MLLFFAIFFFFLQFMVVLDKTLPDLEEPLIAMIILKEKQKPKKGRERDANN